MRIAVAGNPNSGKTTLFNALTGARARVGNYPGVTIERKEAVLHVPSGPDAILVDLPGCYSLTARSPEEEVARNILTGHLGNRPDIIVCVVDATQLARGLYLLVQLMEMALPVVVALNMMDVARAKGLHIDVEQLAERLGVPVIPTSARFGDGLPALVLAATSHVHRTPPAVAVPLAPADKQAVTIVCAALRAQAQPSSLGEGLWFLTSNVIANEDTQAVSVPMAPALRDVVREQRQALDPSGLGLLNRRVIAARYKFVDSVLEGVLDPRQAHRTDSRTEAVDRVLLHPVWGMVVFAATMFGLFQAVFAWAEPLMRGVERVMAYFGQLVINLLPPSHTQSLLLNGVVAGVGNVLAFLPQIALLFFGLTLLEETGYMARAAFLLDRMMRRVGLHGKAFIPLMSSFACAVPGIMAARTVESRRDRLVTILVAPFMSCSARLPVYILVVSACFAAHAAHPRPIGRGAGDFLYVLSRIFSGDRHGAGAQTHGAARAGPSAAP